MTARAQPGFVLAPNLPASWSATFKATPYTAAPRRSRSRTWTECSTTLSPSPRWPAWKYLLDSNVVPAGTYPGEGTVTITARAKTDFVLAPNVPTYWSATFKATPYTATPVAVTFTDLDGTNGDAFTIPSVPGIEYLKDGNVIPAGTYPATGTVTVTARAAVDFVLSTGAPSTWSATFRGSLSGATPTITGTAKVGYMLTAIPGTWNPAAVAFGYQWYRAGVAIDGAAATTYSPNASDVTKTLTVRVTGSKAGYASITQTSAATTPVASGSLAGAVPKITGTAKVGYTLTASPGTRVRRPSRSVTSGTGQA
ncbi:hypothetical protein [Arthrobacter sp. K5]|uniref:MBG domain-containing protein n=1 Tax=Arthrobacter sp. K5 TaxID=2839623 RepID=A0AAU8EWY9_9MICC